MCTRDRGVGHDLGHPPILVCEGVEGGLVILGHFALVPYGAAFTPPAFIASQMRCDMNHAVS
jgi:hypothetical protein